MLGFLEFLVKNRKKEGTRKLGITGPFATAKGGLAATRTRAKKAILWFDAAKPCFAAAKALFTEQIFGFCSESLVFVHRLFRNPNK